MHNIVINRDPDYEKVKCYTMSRQEIAKAVELIQEAPPTDELAELQAFINAQNTTNSSTLGRKHKTTPNIFSKHVLTDTHLYIGQSLEATSSHTHPLCTIAETESPTINTEEYPNTTAQGQAAASISSKRTPAIEPASPDNTVQQNEQDQPTAPVLSAVIDCSVPDRSQTVLQAEQDQQTEAEDEADLSCSFSSDENTVQKTKTSGKKDISSERHAKVDSRIVAQKEAHWKGKDGLRGVNDPRGEALIPIHAPKMERMNIARMKALEARAKASRPPAVEGDIVTPILADIDNVNQINYSVVSVGAEFRTQSEVVKQLAQNDPNSIRPKAPANMMKRKDKVLPFPKRRMAAVRQEQAAKNKKRKR